MTCPKVEVVHPCPEARFVVEFCSDTSETMLAVREPTVASIATLTANRATLPLRGAPAANAVRNHRGCLSKGPSLDRERPSQGLRGLAPPLILACVCRLGGAETQCVSLESPLPFCRRFAVFFLAHDSSVSRRSHDIAQFRL